MMKIFDLPSGPLMVNTYLVEDEVNKKGFIVDPGGHNPALTRKVQEDGIDIIYIILTHGHGDHIGGVEGHKKDFPEAKVVASKAEEAFLADADMNMSAGTLGYPAEIHPDILVDEGDILEAGDMKMKFIMTPGHSLGGMCILVDNVLFSGDTLFRASVGRTDFPGCSFEKLAGSVHDKLFVLPDDTKVMPGHMEQTTIGFEKKNNPFV